MTEVRLLGWDPKTKDTISVSATADSVPGMDRQATGTARKAAALFGRASRRWSVRVASLAEANQLPWAISTRPP